jgi:acetyl-CoA carboxylase beta subunit
MTDTRAALVERMARKLAAIKMLLANDGERLPDDLWKKCATDAEVIADIALEEAARVARTCTVHYPTEGDMQRNVCADAILALKSSA